MILKLWRAETGTTSTNGLGNRRFVIYPSKEACIKGMHAEALAIMAEKPDAFTFRYQPGSHGTFNRFDRGNAKPEPPKDPEGSGVWIVESRSVDPIVTVTDEHVSISYTHEARFFWSWHEEVTTVVDGVTCKGSKIHKGEPTKWAPYVASYQRDGLPTRTSIHLCPESFTAEISDPAAFVQMLEPT
ncbi:MAG: hypothetical protein WC911_01695 [Thermoleophilia bacterium]